VGRVNDVHRWLLLPSVRMRETGSIEEAGNGEGDGGEGDGGEGDGGEGDGGKVTGKPDISRAKTFSF
jgi:hypothetical protein